MLIPLGENLWTVPCPPQRGKVGYDFPTRMCVARLADGSLWVHAPILPDKPLLAELEAQGPIGHLVAPNDLNCRFLPDWVAAFPEAMVHLAPGVEQQCPGVLMDSMLGDLAPPDWQDALDQVIFDDNAVTIEVVFFHRATGTVIFSDLVQQMPSGWQKGWRATTRRADLMTGDPPNVPRRFRTGFRNRRSLRAALAKLRRWPVQRLVMAHGPVIEENAARAVDRAFDWAR